MLQLDEQNHDDHGCELADDMAKWFGIPSPRETECEEVFGWYHVDGDTRYWVHNPQNDSFRVLTSDHQWLLPILAGEWEEGDLQEISQCMNSLQMLARPPLPEDTTVPATSDPFAYEGWLFAWFFVPQLRRWELGVIERRWHVEAKSSSETTNSESQSSARDERRKETLSLATKAFDAGVQLFDRYCKAMLLLGHWEAPDPRDGAHLIRGAASEASSQFSDPTDVVRLVSRATGCEEKAVHSVMAYCQTMGLVQQEWFCGFADKTTMPGSQGFF